MKSHSRSHFLKHALHSKTSSYGPNCYQHKLAQTSAKEGCLPLLLKDMVFPSTEALTICGHVRQDLTNIDNALGLVSRGFLCSKRRIRRGCPGVQSTWPIAGTCFMRQQTLPENAHLSTGWGWPSTEVCFTCRYLRITGDRRNISGNALALLPSVFSYRFVQRFTLRTMTGCSQSCSHWTFFCLVHAEQATWSTIYSLSLLSSQEQSVGKFFS